jgi:hypothetical protein
MFRKLFGEVPDRWLFNYAHVVVEQRYSREGNKNSFALRVGANSVSAAFKWNHRVSAGMVKSIYSWIFKR